MINAHISNEIKFTPVEDTDEREWESASNHFEVWFDTSDADTLKKDTRRIAVVTIGISPQADFQIVNNTSNWRLYSKYRGIGKVKSDGRITWEDHPKELP